MRIKIICVGKIKFDYIKDGLTDYLKRLKPVAKVEINEIKELDSAKIPIEQVLHSEGELILKNIQKDWVAIGLDREGTEIDSLKLSAIMNEIKDFRGAKVCFIIGGSHGLSIEVKKQCQYVLSFSKLTFPHQLFRLILVEQIYRAFEIIKNSEYHK